MAITLEQVEKLREKADVSYEEAKAALEQCGGDLLDALILLERQGKLRPGSGRSAFFTTQPGASPEPPPGSARQAEQPGEAGQRPWRLDLIRHASRRSGGQRAGRFWNRLRELLLAAADLLRHCTVNQFEVWRGGELMTSLPVLILVLLVLVAFWISVPLLVVGLLFGCRYRFSGPDLDKNRVGEVINQVSDSVRDAVGQVKDEIRRSCQQSGHKKSK